MPTQSRWAWHPASFTTPAGVDVQNARCYQLMEAPDLDKVHQWTQAWDDIVDFEIVPVLTSQSYWARFGEKA